MRGTFGRFITWLGIGFWTLIGALTVAWGHPEALFPHRSYAAGPLPVGVVVGDLNGDGILDLVVADGGRNTTQQFHDDGVSVLLGRADGTLGPPTRFTAGTQFPHAPVAMVAGDFNGDGFLDVALANAPPPPDPPFNTYDQGTVSVMLGHGDGTLGPQMHFAAGTYPVAIATGDLNGDGILDLVAASDRANHVSVFVGHGDGSFAAPVAYATAASPKSLTIADFNSDGAPDLAVACAGTGLVSVLVGLGDGTFAPASAYPAGAGASAIAAGDLNGDGRPDLAVGNSIAHTISILRGVGDGTFAPFNTFAAGQSASVVRLGDLDGDGLLDLVEADSGNPPGLVVFRGHGDLLFTPGDQAPAGSIVRDLALADVDGDGHPDLLAARWNGDDVLVLPGRGDAGFGPHPMTLGTRLRPEGIAASDLNGDGHPDMVVANYYDNTISIMLANGAGAFAPEVHLPAGSQPFAVATGDLNGDGSPDLAVANRTSNDVSIYYGRGDGTFNPQLRPGAGAQPVELAIADFDQDGHADLVVANWASLDLTEFVGRSDGTLAPGVRIPLNGLSAPTSLAVADFDGDGRPDLAVGGGVLSMLSAPPAGLLQVRSSEFSECAGWAIATGDLNEDGHPDLALECQPGPTFLVQLGRGDGSFEAPVSYGAEEGGASLVLADFDRDGHLDIAAGLFASAFEVWFGTGDGGFGGAVRFAAGGADCQLATSDFDSDGKPDLAISNDGGEDRVWVLLARPNTPPVADAGPDIRVSCVSPQGTQVTLDGSRSSDSDSTPGTHDDIVQFSWYQDRGLPSQVLLGTGEKLGVSFGVGDHRIDLVVTDHAGAMSTDIMFVEVDVTPPSLACPDLDSIECSDSAGTYVQVRATAGSACAGPVTVTNTRTANGSDASGLYPLGSTTFQFAAIDTQGHRTTCLATVTVQDTQPPALQLVPDPAVLWPPNHGMVPVHVQVAAQDLCGPVTQIVLSSVVSSEPDDAAGFTDGATANDIQGAGLGTLDTDLLLRAERDSVGPGRVYTLTYEATDGAGNVSSGVAVVTVPHDQGQGPEPLLMRVEPGGTPGMVRLYWPAVPGAVGYDVISGALSRIVVQNGTLSLGPVEVLARGTTDTEVSEGAMGVIPSTGECVFYLVQSRTALRGVGYGTESAPWPRVPSSCDGGCP
jgi:hypothetical protein